MKYKINEIYYSLQGEGANTGMPSIFIRFSGCNLNCDFCDTDFEDYRIMTEQDILKEISQYPCKNIVLTGGEPTLQVDDTICKTLKQNNYILHIETNGTGIVNKMVDYITVSPKKYRIIQQTGDELKLVFDTLNPEYFLKYNFKRFYLQPKSMQNTEKVIEYIKKYPIWRLSLQTHKYLKIR